MTQDFTRIGQRPAAKPQDQIRLAANQRVVLLAIYFSATGLLAAGIWLAGGGASPFPADTAPLVGYALIAAATIDGVIAASLKRYWGRPGQS